MAFSFSSIAKERQSDPDGCFSCHALEGLQFIDEDGVLRVSSINKSHYYSSLHGSVPCKDCHRKIRDYPHDVKNGYVDCSKSCHVNEPSDGEAFTHSDVVKEFEKSAHGDGWTKDFAGGNRLQEETEEQDPSCRFCHRNTLYIPESELDTFMDAFAHTDTECGTCHEGEVWLNQFGGHILRRLVGSRWKKNSTNQMCNDCHADHQRMAKVEIEDPKTGEKHKADYRWIHASDSYARTLHDRILVTGVENGAACLDCHAPPSSGFGHAIKADEDKESTTHPENLNKTCGQSGCHEFAKNKLNRGFVHTDMHDLDMVRLNGLQAFFHSENLDSNWFRSQLVLSSVVLIFIFGSIYWLIIGRTKKVKGVLVGDKHFEQIILGRKPKKKAKKAPPKEKPAVKTKNVTPKPEPKKNADTETKKEAPSTTKDDQNGGPNEN